MVHIDTYSSNFFDSFVQLIDESFGIRNSDKSGLVKWKFFSPIYEHKSHIVCSYDNGNIVGQYSNIALELKIHDTKINGYLCQDMCVSPSYRGQKLISKMSSFLYSNIWEKTVSIGFSNKQWVQVDKNSKWYGYHVIHNFMSCYLPVFFSSKIDFQYKLIENSLDLAQIRLDKFSLFQNYITIHKNSHYLKYRYFDKPNADYKMYVITKNNTDVGYVILRYKKWVVTIFDFNFLWDISNTHIIKILKNLTLQNNSHILKIQFLPNDFWEKFFCRYMKLQKKENIYFTVKNHNWFDKIDTKNQNNWGVITGDIL